MLIDEVTIGSDFYLHLSAVGLDVPNVVVVAKFANLDTSGSAPEFDPTGPQLRPPVLQGNSGGFTGYFTGYKAIFVPASAQYPAGLKLRLNSSFFDPITNPVGTPKHNGIHVIASTIDDTGKLQHWGDIFLYVNP